MPLTMAEIDKPYLVKRVGGLEDTKRHLIELGFTEGAQVIVVSKVSGNIIVNVRGARVALDNNLAKKIFVEP